MKRFLLSICCLTAVACSVPATAPPGMPLDEDLIPESGEAAITHFSR